jgi:predicted unusual protein kinase regulating ubiquinone biosynthesis (AarF/ABC1/UbiB family)
MRPIRRMITFILDKFTEKPIDIKAFGQMRSEIYAMFEQQPFRLPPQMTFILKSLTTLDGIARALDPQYNMVAAAQPFIKSIAISKGQGNVFGELGKQAREFIKYRLNQPSATEILIRRLEERIERGELQIRVRAIESDRTLKRINLAVKVLIYACLTGFGFLSGTVLLLGLHTSWATAVFIVSSLGLLVLLRALVDLAIKEKFDKMAEK